MKRLFSVLFIVGLCLTSASADPVASKSQDSVIYPRGTAGAESAEHASAGPGAATLVIGGLLAVGGLWLLWRSRRDAKLVATKGKLVVAETKSLGNKQYLVVASYGDQKFLLGVCPGKIDLLSQLEKGVSPS